MFSRRRIGEARSVDWTLEVGPSGLRSMEWNFRGIRSSQQVSPGFWTRS